MTLTAQPGRYFWSTGYAWGTCIVSHIGDHRQAEITVLYGELTLSKLRLDDTAAVFDPTFHLTAGEQQTVRVNG
jgi:hypothetical protein